MQSGLKSLGARLLGHTYIQANNCYHLICLPKPDLSTLWTGCLLKHFECNWLINSLACCVVSHITITTDLVCFVHILKNKQTNKHKNFQFNCIYCLQCVPLHQCAIIYIYICLSKYIQETSTSRGGEEHRVKQWMKMMIVVRQRKEKPKPDS